MSEKQYRPRRYRPAPKEAPGPQKQEQSRQNIQQLGQTHIPKVESNIHAVTIVGQIEGHLILPAQNKTTKYEHVIPQLVAVEQSDKIEGLLVILNTVGGDVEAGLAIAEMISNISKPVVTLVLGGGHSIGVPIAVSANYSFIAPTATMTVHPIRLTGLVIGVPQSFEYLEKMQDRVIRFVVEHSRVSESNFRRMMFETGQLARDIGTVLVGRDAVDVSLIDEVGGLSQAVNKLQQLIDEKKRHDFSYAPAPGRVPPLEHRPGYGNMPHYPQGGGPM